MQSRTRVAGGRASTCMQQCGIFAIEQASRDIGFPHSHELVEFQRGRCGDDMKCVRPDQEMRALYRFLRRHPCIGLALDPVRGGRPRAQPVVFVVARTECE